MHLGLQPCIAQSGVVLCTNIFYLLPFQYPWKFSFVVSMNISSVSFMFSEKNMIQPYIFLLAYLITLALKLYQFHPSPLHTQCRSGSQVTVYTSVIIALAPSVLANILFLPPSLICLFWIFLQVILFMFPYSWGSWNASTIYLYLRSLVPNFQIYTSIYDPMCCLYLSTVHYSGAVMFALIFNLFMLSLLIFAPVLRFTYRLQTLTLHPWRTRYLDNGISTIIIFCIPFQTLSCISPSAHPCILI